MTIQIINGDILDATEDIIAHQVNGIGVMGAGVAKQIKKKYPLVYRDYARFSRLKSAPKELLGTNLMLTTDGSDIHDFTNANPDTKIISNLFGQAYISKQKPQTDIVALEKALDDLFNFARLHKLSIALPFGIGCGLGCGLGGGNWVEVLKMIKSVADDYPVSLYKFS